MSEPPAQRAVLRTGEEIIARGRADGMKDAPGFPPAIRDGVARLVADGLTRIKQDADAAGNGA
jgi:hypothetical protein